MTYTEKIQDLFAVGSDYTLAHCISADFALGAGIATQFNKRFNMRQKLQAKFGDYTSTFDTYGPTCIFESNVLNLITKRNYWHKPTYDTLNKALEIMKQICLNQNIKQVAMPLIGCGLDKLQWSKVSENIKRIFQDTNIDIVVCKL